MSLKVAPLVMEFDINPVSTNDMYLPTAGKLKEGNSRRSAYLRKSGELEEFQNKFFGMMTSNYPDEIINFIESSNSEYGKYLGFKLTLYLGMHDMYYKRKSISDDLRPYDCSNYIKAIEDVLSTRIKRDDKYNMDVNVIKYHNPKGQCWHIKIVMEAVDYRKYDKSIINEEEN